MSLCSYRAGKKNLGIGQVSLQQSQGTAQLTPTAPKLLLGLPPEGGLHFPALDLLTWDMHQGHTGTEQTICLERYSPRQFLAKGSTGSLLYLKNDSSSLQ